MTTFDDFIDIIDRIPSRELLADFLISVTTDKERSELPQRVEIVKRLIAGQPQQQIARDIGVGVATVTRGSKELQAGRFKVLKND